ncbi:MAG: MFS transporter, partial [Caulobacteraceae bacterium]
VERRVPAEVLTEGVTWVMTGIGIGMALGAFVSGLVVDLHGARAGFWVTIAAATSALAVVTLGQSVLGDRSQTIYLPAE